MPAKTPVADEVASTPMAEAMQPSTQDLLKLIEKLQNDGQGSRFMHGHISKKIIEEQFLADCDKVVDSELAINCADHNKPAVFFSKTLNSWRCF